MTDQPAAPATITDQTAFFNQLGVNPVTVVPNSLEITFDHEGFAHLKWATAIRVTPAGIGMAFLAGSGQLGQKADGESTPAPGTDTPDPSDNVRPIKKTAAARRPVKKTTNKKTTT